MPDLPKPYQWLLAEPGPKMIKEALKLYGVKEMPGEQDNPEILAWAQETGLDRVYSADSVPWCGLAMAVIAKRAGKDAPANPLWAKNWAFFGVAAPIAMLGDVLVFSRLTGGGHVTLYIGESKTYYCCLGGNQSDAFNIAWISKLRIFAIRRPIYKTGQPANVRRITLEQSGAISTNEA